MVSEKVFAETGPASKIRVVMVPGWPDEPRLVARQDNRDAITVVGRRCHRQEVWRLVHLRNGKVLLASYLESPKKDRFSRLIRKVRRAVAGSPARMHRTKWDLTVHVPLALLDRIRVDRERPRPHRPGREQAR